MAFPTQSLFGVRVDAPTWAQVLERVATWVTAGESRYVCLANVHMVMEAYDDPAFRQVVAGADMVLPDGMPVAWLLGRRLGRPQPRMAGAELTLEVCQRAEERGWAVGFYGTHPSTLQRLVRNLLVRFPRLRVVYLFSPPFRPLSPEEDRQVVQAIRAAGVQVLFVALGCPRQERWMAAHRGRIPAVMLGVGAALDFLAGTKPRAPRWMQRWGLEWFFRLLTEPRRLWRRYLKHNPRFVALSLWEEWRRWHRPHG